MTSVRDVVLMRSFLHKIIIDQILCDSMVMSSSSFFEHEEFSLFRFHLSLHLQPFGSSGVATLQSIAEALHIVNFFWHYLRLVHDQDHRSE